MALPGSSDTSNPGSFGTMTLGREHSPSLGLSGAFWWANPSLLAKPTPLHLLPQGRAAYSQELKNICLQEGLVGGQPLVELEKSSTS